MKNSGRKLGLTFERDPDARYNKPKKDSKQISNQKIRRNLKRQLIKDNCDSNN